MGIRWWLIISILVLAGCNRPHSGDGTSAVLTDNSGQSSAVQNEESAQSNAASSNQSSAQSNTTPPNQQPPVIDLAVDSISLPASANRGADFTIRATVRNNSDTNVSLAELEARARVTSPMHVMDLQVGSGSVQNLAPHVSQTVEFKGNIPDYTAPAYTADITVSVRPPGSAKDPNMDNNWRTQNIIVH